MSEIAYGPTPQGQKLYDFGFAKLTDKWLARKYQMPLPEVRRLKADVLKILKPKKRKRKP